MIIENKPIKAVFFKNGKALVCIKGDCVTQGNPNMRVYLNYIKKSIKKIEYQ